MTVLSAASWSSSAQEGRVPAITCAALAVCTRVTARAMPRPTPVTTAVCPVRSMFITHTDSTVRHAGWLGSTDVPLPEGSRRLLTANRSSTQSGSQKIRRAEPATRRRRQRPSTTSIRRVARPSRRLARRRLRQRADPLAFAQLRTAFRGAAVDGEARWCQAALAVWGAGTPLFQRADLTPEA